VEAMRIKTTATSVGITSQINSNKDIHINRSTLIRTKKTRKIRSKKSKRKMSKRKRMSKSIKKKNRRRRILINCKLIRITTENSFKTS
jgi:hypothetical protein